MNKDQSNDLIEYKFIDVEIIKKEVPFGENDLVFIGGSLIEGIGNKLSDLDLFIITDNFDDASNYDMDYDFKNIKYMFKRINDVIYDIEYWDRNVIDTVFEQINSIDLLEIDTKVMNQVNIPNYDFSNISSLIHRMINGINISNQEQFESYVNGLDLRKYHTLMVRYNMSNAEAKYEDIVGNLDSENYSSALFVAKEYLVYLSMALLHSYSISIDRKKWVFKKLELFVEKNPQLEGMINKIITYYFGYNITNSEMMETEITEIIELTEEIYDHITDRLGGI